MDEPQTRQQYLDAMSRVAASVHIITTNGPAGWAGITVTALASVSADGPRPTLLVCLNKGSQAASVIEENGAFCVNTLRDDQAHLADAFAGRFRSPERDKFVHGEWASAPSGCPRLVNPLVAFDCLVQSAETIGSHLVVLGEVGAVHLGQPGSGLVYVSRGYHAPARLDSPRRAMAGEDRQAPGPGTAGNGARGWFKRGLLGGARRLPVT